MKNLFAVLLCLSLTISAYGQTKKAGFSGDDEEKDAPVLTLAREDSEGTIIEDVEVFTPTDIPIICYVKLGSSLPVTVKLNFIAVKVKGVRPNSRIISISYSTKDKEDNVTFTGKPEKAWVIGTYRVDILVAGRTILSKSFTVETEKP